jgi:siroheme synthase-like protein
VTTSTADSRLAIVVHADRVRVLVVGGGTVAGRRALGFAERGASVRVVAPRATDALRDAAAKGEIDLVLRSFQPADVDEADLVVAATDDRAVNGLVARTARESHRLCNVADVPDEGSFSAIAQRASGALLVAVSANGVPAAATRVLDEITGRFDGRYGDALDALRALRTRLLAQGAGEEWERASAELLGGDFASRAESGALAREARAWR